MTVARTVSKALPVVLFPPHTHRVLLRRRHAATHQPGARREVSHLRPDPATAAEGQVTAAFPWQLTYVYAAVQCHQSGGKWVQS